MSFNNIMKLAQRIGPQIKNVITSQGRSTSLLSKKYFKFVAPTLIATGYGLYSISSKLEENKISALSCDHVSNKSPVFNDDDDDDHDIQSNHMPKPVLCTSKECKCKDLPESSQPCFVCRLKKFENEIKRNKADSSNCTPCKRVTGTQQSGRKTSNENNETIININVFSSKNVKPPIIAPKPAMLLKRCKRKVSRERQQSGGGDAEKDCQADDKVKRSKALAPKPPSHIPVTCDEAKCVPVEKLPIKKKPQAPPQPPNLSGSQSCETKRIKRKAPLPPSTIPPEYIGDGKCGLNDKSEEKRCKIL